MDYDEEARKAWRGCRGTKSDIRRSCEIVLCDLHAAIAAYGRRCAEEALERARRASQDYQSNEDCGYGCGDFIAEKIAALKDARTED